ncbi:MAG: hypothetical protein QOF69_1370, partial [Solirubrobacteraceae bacterium]|nr:hypothetical protein [Solirubrobacteraceae bacterium]
ERFAELVATAMPNVQARADVQRLADEQAVLSRPAGHSCAYRACCAVAVHDVVGTTSTGTSQWCST